jgi:hypothetical protein
MWEYTAEHNVVECMVRILEAPGSDLNLPRQTILTEVLRAFPQSVKADAGIVH